MIPELPSDTSGTPASLQIFIIGLYYIKFTITYPLFTVLKYCSSRITPWETCKFIQPLWRALFRDSLLTSIFVLQPSKMQFAASWVWGKNVYTLSHSVLACKYHAWKPHLRMHPESKDFVPFCLHWPTVSWPGNGCSAHLTIPRPFPALKIQSVAWT